MKKILLLIILIYLIFNYSNAHDNKYVHQKIVIEAYNLLKLQLSQEENGIADINTYLGQINTSRKRCKYWNDCDGLIGGADQEDVTNLVFDIQYLGLSDAPYWAHFWDLGKPFSLVKLYGQYNYSGYFPSLFMKYHAYNSDDYVKIIYDGVNNGHCKHWCNKVPDVVLSDYYWKNSIYVNYSHEIYSYSFGFPSKKKENYDWPWGQAESRKMFFNLVGRVCHLLTDCGVPEHVNRSMHDADYSAPLEHFLRDHNDEFYWTADKVYSQRGGFINPFCLYRNIPEFHLFYTTAQLSDVFVNYGHLPSDGDLEYDQSVGEIHSIVQSYLPVGSQFYETNDKNPGGMFQTFYQAMWLISYENARKMRDVLLPYTIRAVAGMLYKYIIEAKMQDQYSTTLSIGSVYDQQQELNLFNQDINGDYYTFRAEGTPGRITVCPPSRPYGYPADFVIGSRARNVTFRAAKEIIFKPGFVANQGAQVHAYLNCNCDRNNQPGNCKECLEEDYNPQYNRSIEQ